MINEVIFAPTSEGLAIENDNRSIKKIINFTVYEDDFEKIIWK